MLQNPTREEAIPDVTRALTASGHRSLELFTGAGGLALGSHLAGFSHQALIEWNREACQTLQLNARLNSVPGIRDWQVVPGDAREVSYAGFGAVDLVAGGPPCQPFSIAGKHHGMDDARNMIPEFVRAIRELAPRAFMMENVRGLLRPAFAAYFEYVLLQLTCPTVTRRDGENWRDHDRRLRRVKSVRPLPDLQYAVHHRQLNAADFGVPQMRERVFVVGFRSDLGIAWDFPRATHGLDALLRDQWITGDYWQRHGMPRPDAPPVGQAARVAQLAIPEFVGKQPWRTVRDALAGLPEPRPDREPDKIHNHRLQPGARSYVGHTGSPLDMPAKTLKAGDHGVPGGENMIAFPDSSVRYFTVREAARLQTFPDAWRLAGSWTEAMRQLGNAVPVELARVVTASVIDQIMAQEDDGEE